MSNERHWGIYDGVVVSNIDPDKKNRVRVRIPQFHGVADNSKISGIILGIADEDLPLAPVVTFHADGSWLPEKGTVVAIYFKNGILDRPVVVGQFPKSKSSTAGAVSDIPDEIKALYPDARGIRTKNFLIILDEKNGKLSIKDLANTNNIIIDSKNNKVMINAGSMVEINGNAQKAVLGDLLKSVVDSFITSFNSHTHVTTCAAGPGSASPTTGPFVDSTNYLSSKVKLS